MKCQGKLGKLAIIKENRMFVLYVRGKILFLIITKVFNVFTLYLKFIILEVLMFIL